MNSSNNAAALPEIPVPLNQQNTAVSCSGPVHIQQSFPTYSNHGIPNFSSYDVQTAQDPAGLYSPCKQNIGSFSKKMHFYQTDMRKQDVLRENYIK